MNRRLDKLKAAIEIMRPTNVIIGSTTTTIAVLTVNEILRIDLSLSLGLPQLITFLLLSYFTYFSIAVAGNTVNDIFDVEIDKVNRPGRPLPSGRLTKREAKILTAVFWCVGVILAFLTNIVGGILAAIFSIIGFIYAAKGKIIGVLGNFMVAFSFSFGLLYGAIIVYFQVLGLIGVPVIVWLYFITAFMVLQGREIIKGIEDMEGDALRGVKTVARKYGVPSAARLAIIFNVIGIISFTSSMLLGVIGITSLPKLSFMTLYVPALISVAGSTLFIAKKPDSEVNQKKASFLDKLGAFLGLFAFLLGAF